VKGWLGDPQRRSKTIDGGRKPTISGESKCPEDQRSFSLRYKENKFIRKGIAHADRTLRDLM
jgi:hypothetical protein